jgi:hypothetical protein
LACGGAGFNAQGGIENLMLTSHEVRKRYASRWSGKLWTLMRADE